MAATQFANNFYTIKQKLSTFSTNSEQIQQKLSTITQTRNKISNQLINLTKDYEKKIKQLQNRLDQTLSKNQILSKQNILYQKDIQAFQIRLVEKQKLIALLITQQNQRFGDNIFSRTKNDYEKDNKDRNLRNTYQSILPKNIQQKTVIFQNQPRHLQTKIKLLVQQNNQQVIHHAQQPNQNQSKNEQQPAYVVQEVAQQNYFQKLSQSQNQQQVQEKPVKSGTVPPPPKSKLRPPAVKNTKKNFPQLISQQVQQEEVGIKPSQTVQQNKNVTNYTNSFQNSNQFDQIFEQNGYQIDKEQNQPIKEYKPIPPPPKKGKTPVPVPKKKPNINKNYNQQKFLQDQNQKQKNIQQNETNTMELVEQKQITLTFNNLQDQSSNLMQNYLTTHNVQQFEQDVKQLRHQNHEGFNQEEIKQVQSQELQQINESHHQMRAPPPPPPKKSIKPKPKSKAIPKQINEANFYQQSSHSQSQEQAYQPQQAPQESQKYVQQEYQHNNSSEDFFANFGRTTTNSEQNLQITSRNSYSSMMEVQQSSIDYTDSHSIISSTAAQMLDSQYFPEQTHQPTIVEMIKMPKKKPNKRQQPKMLDPNSFA